MFGRGILVSMSQVYGVNDITTSTMMNVAVLLASPLLFLTSTFGAILGSLLGIVVCRLTQIKGKIVIELKNLCSP